VSLQVKLSDIELVAVVDHAAESGYFEFNKAFHFLLSLVDKPQIIITFKILTQA
jgi:hypothetical protein